MHKSKASIVTLIIAVLTFSVLTVFMSTTTAVEDPSATDYWPMFGHDLTGARYSAYSAPKTSQILWSTSLDAEVRTAVTVVDGVAYTGTFGKTVYALEASTGKIIWSHGTDGYIWSTPTVLDGMVYVGSNDFNVYGLSAETGREVWRFPTGGGVFSSPAVVDGVVYVGSTDDNMYALNANSGVLIWNYTTGLDIRSTAAVVNGIVYFGSQDGNFYALNAATGAKIWSAPTGDGDTYTNSSPAVVDHVVYIGSTDGNLYAFNVADGSKKWNFSTPSKVSSSPAVYDGVVYVGSESGDFYAINCATGKQIWSYDVGSAIYSSPAIADGIVYFGTYDYSADNVYALNAATGSLVWSYQTGRGVFSSPTIAGSVMFVGSYDRKVYAFGTSFNSTSSPAYTSTDYIVKTAWVPPVANGVAASVVTIGAVSTAAIVAAAVTSVPASIATGLWDKIIDKVRSLIPDFVKKWIEAKIASKRKLSVDEKEGSPYLPTKGELIVYTISVALLTLSFAYVKVADLSQFWVVLPTFFATSIIVSIAKIYIITVIARRREVWTEFKLWYFGLAMFLISTFAFRTPFSSPTRRVHNPRNYTSSLGGLFSVITIFITLGFAGIFFAVLKSGFVLVGSTGLAMCLISAFFDTFPVEPLSGKAVYKYNKKLWLALFFGTLALYAAWLAHAL